jgi:hypothetical protein
MTHIRYFAAAAALTLFTACDAQHGESFLSPNPDLITGITNVARTKNVEKGNKAVALIMPTGGSISVDGHTLKVPAGAISQPTWFSMQIVEASVVHVRLRAWRALDGVAVTQFPNEPVRLTLDASHLEKLDPTGLVIVYLRDGTYEGARETVPSTVNTSNWTVTGYLSHFSSYALAREYSPGID